MANPIGRPIWYEYAASDADAAAAFYHEVIGWSIAPSGMSDMDYRMLTALDGDQVGGLMQTPQCAPMRPGWHTYLLVEDVDAAVAQVEAESGTVPMPAVTMEGVGRMALVADPQGAAFYLMQPAGEGESRSFESGASGRPGHFVWNELLTPDQEAAMAFYGGLLGWRHEGGMPMGPLGDYRFVFAGSVGLGATMRAPPGEAGGWRFYTYVGEIDAAAERVTKAGGSVRSGPDPIPGGGFSLLATDPFGVAFGLVGQRGG